ncbi:MAG TPA: HAD hydrolase family protein [Bacteroidales bacterium]|nr:HAD hydrolase family protein [Bacteroidales bacterium]
MTPLKDLNFKEKLKNIKAFIFDVDGVLSKAVVSINTDGTLERTTNVKDGYAIKRALDEGFIIGIISGGKNGSVRERFSALGVNSIYLNSDDKTRDLREILDDYKLDTSQIVYMGDDLPDYDVMKQAGVSTCPADADEEIKGISLYISEKKGGEGCVRDIISQVMRTQNKWYK